MQTPAFLFYYKDFDADTAAWPAEAVGWYIRLLCYQAKHGHIPANTETMAQIARVSHSQYGHFQTTINTYISQQLEPIPATFNQPHLTFNHKPLTNNLHHPKLTKVIAESAAKAATKSILAHLGNWMKQNKVDSIDRKNIKKQFKIENYLHLSPEDRKSQITQDLNQYTKKANPQTPNLKPQTSNLEKFLETINATAFKEAALKNHKITEAQYQQAIDLYLLEKPDKQNPAYFNQALISYSKRIKDGNTKHSIKKDNQSIIGAAGYNFYIPSEP